ncbi:unknown [Prevotella sp. CAG:1124]|nr:unknown [Prevotella sp. CAG:1124]
MLIDCNTVHYITQHNICAIKITVKRVKHDRCKHKKPSIIPAKTVNDTTINGLLLLKNNSIKTKLTEIQNKYGSIQTVKRTIHGLCFSWFSH